MEKINQTFWEFLSISSEIDKAYHKAAIRLGLSDTQMYVLYFLSQKEYSQKQICELSGISKQTVNSAIKEMIAKGYIAPLKGEKNESITLTKDGEKVVEDKVSRLIRAENNVISKWSDEERTYMVNLNRKFLKAFLTEIESL